MGVTKQHSHHWGGTTFFKAYAMERPPMQWRHWDDLVQQKLPAVRGSDENHEKPTCLMGSNGKLWEFMVV